MCSGLPSANFGAQNSDFSPANFRGRFCRLYFIALGTETKPSVYFWSILFATLKPTIYFFSWERKDSFGRDAKASLFWFFKPLVNLGIGRIHVCKLLSNCSFMKVYSVLDRFSRGRRKNWQNCGNQSGKRPCQEFGCSPRVFFNMSMQIKEFFLQNLLSRFFANMP